MKTQYEFHPISEVFPMMDQPELDELGSDIQRNSQRDAIVLFQGKILDGRNRERACQQKGIEPVYQEFIGTEDQAIDYVESKNLRRRNLNESQRAMAAAEIANLRRGQHKETNPPIGGSVSQADAAKRFNISPRSVERAAKVLKKGVPQLIEQVKSGDRSLGNAEVIASHNPGKQVRLLKKGRDKIAAYASSIKVESSVKKARTTVDLCLCCNDGLVVDKVSFLSFLQMAARMIADKPGGPKFARYLYANIDEINELDVAEEVNSIDEKIFAAIDNGYQTGRDILRVTNLSKRDFEFASGLLLKNGFLEKTPQGGKTEVARGGVNMLWQRSKKAELKPDDDWEGTEFLGPAQSLSLAGI